jgi:oligopeptide/dipeptide ABC transporter ATP-binding protein
MSDNGSAVLVSGLTKSFPVRQTLLGKRSKLYVHAVQSVNLQVHKGETLGIVGESGSGKTTLALMLAGLLEPSEGSVQIQGKPITGIKGSALRAARRSVQMVFQDPYTSLNPRLSVRKIIAEPMKIAGLRDQSRIDHEVDRLLDVTGVPKLHASRTPDAFSGGQRQRIAIARALALKPPVLICDEPTSALDVSVQARIINLLRDIQQEFGISIVFVSHDLNIVRLVTKNVAVMYLGRIVEYGGTEEVFSQPQHPYTTALTNAIPDPRIRRPLTALKGEVPSNIDVPTGCAFKTRCPHRADVCEIYPHLTEHDNRLVACHLVGRLSDA